MDQERNASAFYDTLKLYKLPNEGCLIANRMST